jgi:hypothetical protein
MTMMLSMSLDLLLGSLSFWYPACCISDVDEQVLPCVTPERHLSKFVGDLNRSFADCN